jgi:hypothetical protein
VRVSVADLGEEAASEDGEKEKLWLENLEVLDLIVHAWLQKTSMCLIWPRLCPGYS